MGGGGKATRAGRRGGQCQHQRNVSQTIKYIKRGAFSAQIIKMAIFKKSKINLSFLIDLLFFCFNPPCRSPALLCRLTAFTAAFTDKGGGSYVQAEKNRDPKNWSFPGFDPSTPPPGAYVCSRTLPLDQSGTASLYTQIQTK